MAGFGGAELAADQYINLCMFLGPDAPTKNFDL